MNKLLILALINIASMSHAYSTRFYNPNTGYSHVVEYRNELSGSARVQDLFENLGLPYTY